MERLSTFVALVGALSVSSSRFRPSSAGPNLPIPDLKLWPRSELTRLIKLVLCVGGASRLDCLNQGFEAKCEGMELS